MPAPSESARPRPQKTLYGRRKGPKLSAHQATLVETFLPGLEVRLHKGADPKHYFDGDIDEVWLEVGFGAGEHLLEQVLQHRKVGIIGAEPYESGVAKLLSKLSAAATRDDLLKRVGIHRGDAREIIEALPDASLGRLFLLFPDPWPKKRHHKRRFIQMETLDALARVMKPGAEFRFASDDPDYVAWTLEHMSAHDAFEWFARRPSDWLSRGEDWPATRYENKSLHGKPVFLSFFRMHKIVG